MRGVGELVFHAAAEALEGGFGLRGGARREVRVRGGVRVVLGFGVRRVVVVVLVIGVEGDDVVLCRDAVQAADFCLLFGREGVHVCLVVIGVVPD